MVPFFAMGCSDNPIGMDQDRSAIMNLDFAFPRLSTFLRGGQNGSFQMLVSLYNSLLCNRMKWFIRIVAPTLKVIAMNVSYWIPIRSNKFDNNNLLLFPGWVKSARISSTFLDRDGDHVRLGMCLCGLSVYYSVRSGGGTLGHLINLGPVTALILHIATARLLEMLEHINCA